MVLADHDVVEISQLARPLLALPGECAALSHRLRSVALHWQESRLPILLGAGVVLQFLLLLPTEQIPKRPLLVLVLLRGLIHVLFLVLLLLLLLNMQGYVLR